MKVMKSFWCGLFNKKEGILLKDERNRELKVLYKNLSDFYGHDQLIIKASRLESFELMSSDKVKDRLLALERIIYDDSAIQFDNLNFDERIKKIEEKLADLIAERSVEEDLDEQIAERMEEKQKEYLQEIKKEIVWDKKVVDNANTLKKLAHLEKLETRTLNRTTLEMVRPRILEEIVGQKSALKALVSKIASPYPQHIILYGPPGVGKTTAARLALEEAKKRKNTPFYDDSQFVEVDGTTLRWDPREVTNPLLGSVHDPIYQGAKQNLADGGVPEPKTGLVTEAHGGILFIDEIGELDPMLQNKLLKVMEDKRITFESSYYDKYEDNIPLYIKKLFEEGAPADFILIGATTRNPEEINLALRSRCAEVFFNPLTRKDIQEIIINAVKKLNVQIEKEIPEVISKYTNEGRKAINLLLDAYSLVLFENEENNEQGKIIITKNKLYEAIQSRRLTPNQQIKVDNKAEIGKIFGLGVTGFLGMVIEIEAVAFPAQEKGMGKLRFNETAGTMAKDSLFNAAAVIRKIIAKNMNDYDLHVNIIGGGNIDGPSAGVAILLAIISAIEEIPIRQDIAVTGEVSIQGKVKPVGGIREKLYGAEQSGIKEVLVPEGNINDILDDLVVKLAPISTVEDALRIVLVDNCNKLKLA
jgi:ATP-dependent Lon protease